jgi:hypothetical protein
MAKPQTQKMQGSPEASSMNDWAPKQYSVPEQAIMALKILLILGVLFGFLWVVSLLKVQ